MTVDEAAFEAERIARAKQKSVRQFAYEHNVKPQLMKWLMKEQGRFDGVPGNYSAAEGFKIYEHPVMADHPGESYDPEMFRGLDLSPEAVRKAEASLKEYKAQQKELALKAENEFRKKLQEKSGEAAEVQLRAASGMTREDLIMLGVVGGAIAVGVVVYLNRKRIKKCLKKHFKRDSDCPDDEHVEDVSID